VELAPAQGNMLKFGAVKKIFTYFREVRIELSKVVWPKKQEVSKLTLVVFFVSAIIGAYVGLLDFVFTKLLELTVAK
jgi:preprotein translocase subunit SecE